MKSITLLSLLAAAVVALPSEQFVLQPPSVITDAAHSALDWFNDATHEVADAVNGVQSFERVTTEGIDYEMVTHSDFPSYAIRLTEPKLCDPTVKQYSGYLDIDKDTHLFFWFFEARATSPAPLALWLNGGPGCSSSTGLLFELGPCSIANEGQNTTFNKNSWNNNANMIFLDSPVQVGYSYGGKTVSNSQDTAHDVYAFMQLFYHKFPKFAKSEFHVTGESYAGTYIPNIGSVIHNANLVKPTPNALHIPLASLLIGNGLTDALTQFPAIPDHACAPSKFAIFDDATCADMRSKVPTCTKLTESCYNSPNRFSCVAATLACWRIAGPIQTSGRNPYDVRKKCDRDGEDGPLCYRQMAWIETYLNKPEIKKELGVSPERNFESCNMKINQAFQFNGDVSHNTVALLPELLEAGIRILVVAGEADFMCNYIGNLKWTLALPWSQQSAYNNATTTDFTIPSQKKAAGQFRQVGKGAGTLTYLQIYDAGHMIPYDQPEAALSYFNRWIANESFA